MRIRSNTTDFSKEFLHEVFDFCKPCGVKSTKVDLYVGNTKNFRCGHMEHKSFVWDSNRIVLYILKADDNRINFPHACYRTSQQVKRGYLSLLVLDRIETLVEIMAHELRHIYQEQRKHKIKCHGKRRQKFSERDADMYAQRKIREWRKLHYRDAIDLGRCCNEYL